MPNQACFSKILVDGWVDGKPSRFKGLLSAVQTFCNKFEEKREKVNLVLHDCGIMKDCNLWLKHLLNA